MVYGRRILVRLVHQRLPKPSELAVKQCLAGRVPTRTYRLQERLRMIQALAGLRVSGIFRSHALFQMGIRLLTSAAVNMYQARSKLRLEHMCISVMDISLHLNVLWKLDGWLFPYGFRLHECRHV